MAVTKYTLNPTEPFMKPTLTTTRKLLALATMTLASLAFAGGNPAGGHGHDTKETAIGKPGVATKATRTITIEAGDDMRYTPSDIRAKQGETIRFVVKNTGKVKHELGLGTKKELLKHSALMKRFPDMEHDEPNKVTLAPGKQGEIVWHFTKAGTVHFACLMPGHYEAGMKGKVSITKK
jgi:uncharacterized cupredoxin-like copper-binding protein